MTYRRPGVRNTWLGKSNSVKVSRLGIVTIKLVPRIGPLIVSLRMLIRRFTGVNAPGLFVNNSTTSSEDRAGVNSWPSGVLAVMVANEPL